MTRLEIFQFSYNADNYGVLLHCPDSGDTACIDAGDATATEAALTQSGWSLTHLFITHHHGDHTAGLTSLKATHNAHVIGPPPRSTPISGIDHAVWDGDSFEFANRQVHVIATPGHTTDMINFYLPDEKIVFTGDTLFSLGCGRIFEGTYEQMFGSLNKLKNLPGDTKIYCGREYTYKNLEFCLKFNPSNILLKKKKEAIELNIKNKKPSIPSTIGDEIKTNIFFRFNDPDVKKAINLENSSDLEIFTKLRDLKDGF